MTGMGSPPILELTDRARDVLQPLGDFDFQLSLRGEMRAFTRLRSNGIGHALGGVTEEKRALSALEINGFVAIDIPQTATLAVREIEWHRLLEFADIRTEIAHAARGLLVTIDRTLIHRLG